MSEITRIRFTPQVSESERGNFTAICDELGLAAMGRTEEQAKINLKRTVESFCNALQRRDLLTQALKESGIRAEIIHVDIADGEMLLHLSANTTFI